MNKYKYKVWRKELERGDFDFKIWMKRMLYVILKWYFNGNIVYENNMEMFLYNMILSNVPKIYKI